MNKLEKTFQRSNRISKLAEKFKYKYEQSISCLNGSKLGILCDVLMIIPVLSILPADLLAMITLEDNHLKMYIYAYILVLSIVVTTFYFKSSIIEGKLKILSYLFFRGIGDISYTVSSEFSNKRKSKAFKKLKKAFNNGTLNLNSISDDNLKADILNSSSELKALISVLKEVRNLNLENHNFNEVSQLKALLTYLQENGVDDLKSYISGKNYEATLSFVSLNSKLELTVALANQLIEQDNLSENLKEKILECNPIFEETLESLHKIKTLKNSLEDLKSITILNTLQNLKVNI